MDLVQTVRKEGSRGGRADFRWEDVKNDSQRENYLGHSVMAPVGRWQQGRDLNWYAKGDADSKAKEADVIREEKRKLKEAEHDAMLAAMGLPVPVRDNANLTPLGERAHEAEVKDKIEEKAADNTTDKKEPREKGKDRDREHRHRHHDRHHHHHRHDDDERRKRDRSHDRHHRHRHDRSRDRTDRHRDRSRERSRDRRRHNDRDRRERHRRRSRSRSRDRKSRDDRSEHTVDKDAAKPSRSRSLSRNRRHKDTRSRSPYRSERRRD